MDSSETVALSGRVSEVRDRPEGERERERGGRGGGGGREGGGGGGGGGGVGGNVFHIQHCALREREREDPQFYNT